MISVTVHYIGCSSCNADKNNMIYDYCIARVRSLFLQTYLKYNYNYISAAENESIIVLIKSVSTN